MRARRPRGDQGTVLVLVLGFHAVLVLLVGVVVDVSSVVLAKRAVAGAADGAAVSAAQALDVQALYAGGLGGHVPLDLAGARSRVAAYEAQVRVDQPGLSLGLRLEGGTAVVTATRTVGLPFRLPGAGPVRVRAVARARAPVRP